MNTVNKTLQNHVEVNKSDQESSPLTKWAPINNSDDWKIVPTEVFQETKEDMTVKNKENSCQSISLKLKPEQSYKKETKASRLGKSTGRWTQREHILFIEGLKIYGKNWKKVESFIGTRTGTQIRSHAQKFFNRIRKEFSTEDPSKYVIDHMGDENIRKIIMEDCDDDASNWNEEKDIINDTPEVLFSITKDKVVKQKKNNDEEDSPKSIGASTSAFKSFKREKVDPPTEKEDSKFPGKSGFQNNPLSKRQVITSQTQNPVFNPLSSLIGGLNTTIPNQISTLPLDPSSILLQAILSGNSMGQFNSPAAQNLNNTVLNLLMTLALRSNITN